MSVITLRKKILASLLSTLLAFPFPLVAGECQFQANLNQVLGKWITSYGSLNAAQRSSVNYQQVYVETPQQLQSSYANSEAEAISSRLSSEGVNHRIEVTTGYGCHASACMRVSYSYDGLTFVQITKFYENFSEGSTESAGGFSGDDRAEQREFDRAVAELQRKNQELNRENRALAAVKNRLRGKEDRYGDVLRERNAASQEMEDSGRKAEQAKQRASNSRIERDRLNEALEKRKLDRENLEKKLGDLNREFENLVGNAERELHALAGQATGVEKGTAHTTDQLNQAVGDHNDRISNLREVAQIDVALSYLDYDVDAALAEIGTKSSDLENLPNKAFKTTDKKYLAELQDAQRYLDATSARIQGRTDSEIPKQLLEGAQLGIDAADENFAANEVPDGEQTLRTALNLIDAALDWVSGVSGAKDAITLVTGKNPVTGEAVTDLERTIILGSIFVPAFMSGAVKTISKAVKGLSRVVKHGGKSAAKAQELIDVVKRADAVLVSSSKEAREVGERVDEVVDAARKFDIPANKVTDFVTDLASPKRRGHILHGDTTGGGHMYPGKPGKNVFPKSWDGDKIMHEISDIATDPKINWKQVKGLEGQDFTRAGKPSRWEATGVRDGVEVKVIVEPAGEGIISSFPVRGPGVVTNP